MMTSNNITNNSELIMNPHACVASTSKNPRDYSSFNIHLVLNYMNNQIIYHYITGVIPAAK